MSDLTAADQAIAWLRDTELVWPTHAQAAIDTLLAEHGRLTAERDSLKAKAKSMEYIADLAIDTLNRIILSTWSPEAIKRLEDEVARVITEIERTSAMNCPNQEKNTS